MTSTRFGRHAQSRILVVDDEPTIAVTLAAILEEEGYDAETAFSGEEAVRSALRFNPNLLITDLIMGAMNGLETAARITAMFPDCRVLFFSGSGSIDDLAQMAPEGLVYSFARKPTPVPDLLNAIAYIVSSVNNVYDPIASIDDRSFDKGSAQGWRVARLAPAPQKSFAHNAFPGAPFRESSHEIPCTARG